MTTPNEELRKLADDLDVFVAMDGGDLELIATASKAIRELLDRIDRLEAENEAKDKRIQQLNEATDLAIQINNDHVAAAEAKDRLLVQALKDLVIFNEASRLHGMYWQRKHIDAITQHLKGAP